MSFTGCQGKKGVTITDKICPNCGNSVELFSIDAQAVCDRCGFIVYNDSLDCVQWCKYARQCVGDEMYERLMKVAEAQKARKAEVKALQE